MAKPKCSTCKLVTCRCAEYKELEKENWHVHEELQYIPIVNHKQQQIGRSSYRTGYIVTDPSGKQYNHFDGLSAAWNFAVRMHRVLKSGVENGDKIIFTRNGDDWNISVQYNDFRSKKTYPLLRNAKVSECITFFKQFEKSE